MQAFGNELNTSLHKAVLLQETIENLNLKKGDVVFDGTLGGGTYAYEIAKRISPGGRLIGSDLDSSAIERAERKLKDFQKVKFSFYNKNYSEISEILKSEGLDFIDAATLDLGISTDQLLFSKRGISFKNLSEPLDMNLSDKESQKKVKASEILNEYPEECIAEIIYHYGGEKAAKKIARRITEKRKEKPFETVKDLVELLENSIGFYYRKSKISCATKTFQALRIAVNDEMENLQKALDEIVKFLSPGGRLCVVSFHSLEDRIVKRKFKDFQKEALGKIINKKVITPSKKELGENKKARSSKLRVFEKK